MLSKGRYRVGRGAQITVSEIGEFALIERIVARFRAGEATLLGPGDDAAVVRAPDGRVVATTDLLVEGRHFDRRWSTAYEVGRKAAAANLADIAAMGASPTALLVGFAAPADLPVEWVEGLADGLRDETAPLAATVVGGDVVASSVLTIAVTALGDLAGREPVTRGGARPGDRLVLVGRLGFAAAGLAALRSGRGEEFAELVTAHRCPTPPYAVGPVLAEAGATAMIDVSDGLIADAGHIAAASRCGVDIETSALPVGDELRRAATSMNIDAMHWVLAGGDDHALLATVPADGVAPDGAVVIGRCIDGDGVTVDGASYAGAGGWTAFE